MKWIGQHIYDLISRFRNDVYIGDDANLTITTITGTAVDVDIDEAVYNPDIIRILTKIYYEKSHALGGGETNVNTGLNISMQDTATNNASSSSALYGAIIELNHTSAQGDVTKTGLTISTAGESDTSATHGIITNIADGGTDIRLNSSATISDNCTIKTGTNGATTIETTDGSGHDLANFEIEADGNITLDPAGTIALEANTTVTGDVTTTGNIELGHASDTTIARSAAGKVTIEGNQIVTDGSVNVASGASAPIAMRVARRTLTQAEMNDLHNTPIEIIPAPGANKIIIINSGGNFIMADRAATNTATSTLGIGFDGFTESFSTLYNRRFMNSITTDILFNLEGYLRKSATVLTDGVNKKVEAKFFGACTNNCFTSVDVVISYYILDLS